MIRAVVDTNVILSGMIGSNNESPPNRIVDSFGASIRPVFSAVTFAELQTKLANPKFSRHIDQSEIREYLLFVKDHSEHFQIEGYLDICRDPKDNMILETALTANAQVLVSGDKDLLVLAEAFSIPICSPREFVDTYL